jgi:hypothetical protein
MSAFLENPRRVPRAQVRCEARIALREGGFWTSPTSDYGPRGCQLEAPTPLTPGSRIFVELLNERTGPALALAGRVAWCAKAPPWRMGIAFDAGSVPAATRFFEQLTAAYPGIDTSGHAPDRVPVDAPLAPAPPPDLATPALTAEEARVLRLLGPGRSAGALAAELGGGVEGATNALFSLLGRKYVVVGLPDPAASDRWAPVVAERGSG